MSVQRMRAYLTKPETVRQSNDQIAERAVRYRFVSRIPMLCECGNPSCTAIVQIALDSYRELRQDPYAFLTAPGHTLPEALVQGQEADYWLQRRMN